MRASRNSRDRTAAAVSPIGEEDRDVVTQSAAMAAELSMYLRYFGLHEVPFTITPDPRYLYLSRRHQEGLAHLLFGVGQGGSGGFVQLTGEVGTGKTTLCRSLLEQVPEHTQIALILNPVLTPVELLATLCDELGLTYPEDASSKMLMDLLTEYLLQAHAQGERVVVVIDEAQNLSRDALEQVRLLTNLETATDKLLQIVLLGQPELRQLLARDELRQLAQRITARYHLEPMDRLETIGYIRHRLAVAGAVRCPLSKTALNAVYRHSQGVPRLINIITDRALMGAYARDHANVGSRMVDLAAREVRGERPTWPWPRHLQVWLWAGFALILGALGATWYAQQGTSGTLELAPLGLSNKDNQSEGEPSKSEPNNDDPSKDNDQSTPSVITAAPVALPSSSSKQAIAREVSLPLPPTVDAVALWQHYGQLWRSDGETLRAACEDARSGAYLCLRQSASWQRLARLGLPVVLLLENTTLTEPAAHAAEQLLLLGLRGDAVLVHNGERAWTIDKRSLEPFWLGEYWVVAPGRSGTLQTTDNSAEVYRLKSLAAALRSMPYKGPLDERFDPSLENWVRAFQRQSGLNTDGIVGPATRLYLAAAVLTEPKLLEEW